jgi:hypothetical protein
MATLASDCRWHLSVNNPVTGRSTLIITTVTTGSSIDTDGYSIAVLQGDQEAAIPRHFQANDTQSLQLDPDAVYIVTLGGLAVNCGVVGTNPRNIQLTQDATVETQFQVACLRSGL